MKWPCIAASTGSSCRLRGQDRNKQPTGAADLRVADAAMASGMPQTALSVTREILSGRSAQRRRRCCARAKRLLAMGQARRGRGMLPAVLAIDPTVGRRAPRPGPGRLAMGQAQEAETVFRKAIELAPNDAAALNNLGIALDLQDRHDEAQAAYQAALAQRPA